MFKEGWKDVDGTRTEHYMYTGRNNVTCSPLGLICWSYWLAILKWKFHNILLMGCMQCRWCHRVGSWMEAIHGRIFINGMMLLLFTRLLSDVIFRSFDANFVLWRNLLIILLQGVSWDVRPLCVSDWLHNFSC